MTCAEGKNDLQLDLCGINEVVNVRRMIDDGRTCFMKLPRLFPQALLVLSHFLEKK